MKAFKRLFVLIACAFILMPVAFAKTTTTTVPALIATQEETTTKAPEVIEPFKTDREELVGNIVNVDKDLSNTSFAAGNIVTFKSKVDGIAFVAGNTVNISGQSDYSFIAGNNVTVTGLKTKDLFVAGSIITMNDVEARDIYAGGAEVTIFGEGSNLYVAGETVTLKGSFKNVTASCDKLIIEGAVSGTLKVNEDAELTADEDKINEIKTYKNDNVSVEIDPTAAGKAFAGAAFVGVIIGAIIKLLGTILVGVVFILILKKTTNTIVETSNSFGYIAARFGIGFATLIGLPIVSILLLCTGIGAYLSVILLIFYVLLILLSSIVGTLYFGKLAFKNLNNYVRFILMALIIALVKLVPILGGLVSFILLCLGIGVLVNTIFTIRKGK